MNTILKKTAAAGFAALTLALAAGADPAAAKGWGKGAFIGGIFGGLALGAIAASAAAEAATPYEGDCYMTRQPVYSPYGDFLGYRRTEVCN